MKNQKILFLIKLPPPLTGATLMNQRINNSKYLHKKFDIRTISASYARDVSMIGKFDLRKYIVFLSILVQLIKELVFFRPAMVYFQITPLGTGFLRDSILVVIIKLFRKKIAFHLRGKGIQKAIDRNFLLKAYYNIIFNGVIVICLSRLLTYDVESFRLNGVFVVNNGLPDIDPKWIKISTENTNKMIRIIFLSNLILSKGIADFIDALKLLDDNHVSFHASIVGAEGDMTSDVLMESVYKNKLGKKVTYEGSKYDDDKNMILSKCDILVFPSKNDAFPGVVVEGMQFELPIVSTYEGSIPYIVDDGVTGYLVEKDNPRQLAEKMSLLIGNRSLIKKMGQAGRQRYLKKFTFTKKEENLGKVFEQILE